MDFIFTSWMCLFNIAFLGVADNIGVVTKDCNVSVEAEGITISSPDFPDNYINNARCWYVIRAPLNYVVTLVFSSFAVEKGFGSVCRYDRLLVYDGSTYQNDPLHTLCGYALPAPITSTSNSLTLIFESDDALSYSGFQARSVFTSPGGVDQQNTFNSKVESRLSGGDGVNSGRVEVLLDNQWSSICGDGWDITHANATCKHLGYEYALQATRGIRFGLGSAPVYNLTCSSDVAGLSSCSYYKDPDQQCNHWGFAGVVCSVLILTTSDLEADAVSTNRELPILILASLLVFLFLGTFVTIIVQKKRQNSSTLRFDILQLQNRQLPYTPNKECITVDKCVPDTAVMPLRSPVNIRNPGPIYADPLYEKCEDSFSTIGYSQTLLPSSHFILPSQECTDPPHCKDSTSKSTSNTYNELSDNGNNQGKIAETEHAYSEVVTDNQNSEDVNKGSCDDIEHIYNSDDVYASVA